MTEKQYKEALRLLEHVSSQVREAMESLDSIEQTIDCERTVDQVVIYSNVYEEMCDEMGVDFIETMGIS